LPEAPFLTLSLKPAPEGGILMTLLNASDNPQAAEIRNSVLKLKTVHRCDLFGKPSEEIPVENGACRLTLGPRRIATLRLEIQGD
jgi:hypothetical protein